MARNDLVLKIDKRYIAFQILKAILGYCLGVLIVILKLKPCDKIGFIVVSLLSATIVYLFCFHPRMIFVTHGMVSFVKNNTYHKCEIKISDVAKVTTSTILYNTITIVTKSGMKYHLHPQEMKPLEAIFQKQNYTEDC